ncbi:MAG: hypothetical protein JXJ04_19385 [Spirochaetales bacterium]|nr:hypothetical protein [Spirochaetales bacterium]
MRKKQKKNSSHFCVILFHFALCCLLSLACSSTPVEQTKETPKPVIEEPEKVQALKEQVVFYDDFSDTTQGWETGEENFILRTIENGFYVFENTHDYNSAFSNIPVDNPNTHFFIIESSMEKITGKDESSYGLSWGFDRETHSSYFILLYENFILYGKQENGKWGTIINWKQFPFIKRIGANKIAIKVQNETLEVFVNEQYVYKTTAYPLFGDTIGFILFGENVIKADFMLVTNFQTIETSAGQHISEDGLIITPDHLYLFEKQKE